MRSHSHLQKQSDAEPWVDLDYYDETTVQAAAARTAFLATSESPVPFGVSASTWVE
jgi:hypothetical protein